MLTQLYGEKNYRVNDARWTLYQVELMIGWRGNQRQQLTQADSYLGQAAQTHQRLKALDDGSQRPSAEQRNQIAQTGVQAAKQAVALRKQVLGEGNPAVADAQSGKPLSSASGVSMRQRRRAMSRPWLFARKPKALTTQLYQDSRTRLAAPWPRHWCCRSSDRRN